MSLFLLIAALFLAPLLARWLKASVWHSGLEAFVLITICGVVIFTLIPDAIAHGGLLAMPFAFIALGLPWLAERIMDRHGHGTHRILMVVAASALVLHGISDGVVLRLSETSDDGWWIGAGLIVHRFGAAMGLWLLLSQVMGLGGRLATLLALGGATLIGYLGVSTGPTGATFGLWQALAAGSLMHILLHPLSHHHESEQVPSHASLLPQRFGTALGFALIIAYFSAHLSGLHMESAAPMTDSHHRIDQWMAVGIAGAPILLLVMFSGVIIGWFRKKTWAWNSPQVVVTTSWSIGLWVLLSLASEVGGMPLPLDQNLPAGFFFVWVLASILIITHQGARGFLTTSLGRRPR